MHERDQPGRLGRVGQAAAADGAVAARHRVPASSGAEELVGTPDALGCGNLRVEAPHAVEQDGERRRGRVQQHAALLDEYGGRPTLAGEDPAELLVVEVT